MPTRRSAATAVRPPIPAPMIATDTLSRFFKGQLPAPNLRGRASLLAVFVPAISDQPVQIASVGQDTFDVFGVLVIGDAEPDANNHASHGRSIEYVAHGHVRDADGVSIRDQLERSQEVLELGPATPGLDHPLVLLKAGSI